ncbi:MAG: hypothetical protein M0001_04645, partial [Treponema sp.]|nr:hypothetical protein [Treponema sp.]
MNTLVDSLGNFWMNAHPTLRGATVLVVGLFAAWALKKVVEALLGLLKFDRIADKFGLGEFLRKGAVPYKATKLVGAIVGWIAILVALLATSRTLDISFVNTFSDNLVATLPSALAAIIVIIVGIMVVSF